MATEVKFTKGPWSFQPDDGTIYAADGDVEARIATIEYDNTGDEQYFADGNLIAAAPDLFAAVHALLAAGLSDPKEYPLYTPAEQLALAAFLKAQGLPHAPLNKANPSPA